MKYRGTPREAKYPLTNRGLTCEGCPHGALILDEPGINHGADNHPHTYVMMLRQYNRYGSLPISAERTL